MIQKCSFNLNDRKYTSGGIVCWVQRDQRAVDNRALTHAAELAKKHGVPLCAVFCLSPVFTNAVTAHYSFMLAGLKNLERSLASLNIPFYLLYGDPAEELPAFARTVGAGQIVTDFLPLKIAMKWKQDVASAVDIPVTEVDAHNIVPCRLASPKKEYSAATFRPKLKRLLPDFLYDMPQLPRYSGTGVIYASGMSVDAAMAKFRYDGSLPFESGEKAALKALDDFVTYRLCGYAKMRNDPNLDAQSGLSPYFHFGQLSPQRAALSVLSADAPQEDKDAFIEELTVRRELADNYCFYNENYDNIQGADNWALKTLDEHRADRREYIYDYDDLACAKTHDDLWNAAQTEMVTTGKMHGYMRMYWAKKILEWSPDPETAFKNALLLNDTYSMDGRDPNGYVGVAWSVAGVHDRAWAERPVFGKIRYMNYNGCRSKFDVKGYINKIKKP